MPTANETRVRVEDLSKITATVCGPASGLSFQRSFLSATARSRISACSAGGQVVVAQQVAGHAVTSVERGVEIQHSASSTVRSDAVNSCDELVDLDVADVERRHEPDRLVVRGVDDEAVLLRGRDDRLGDRMPQRRRRSGGPGRGIPPTSGESIAADRLAQLAAALGGVAHEALVLDLGEDGAGDRGAEGVAAERRAVRARVEQLARARRT